MADIPQILMGIGAGLNPALAPSFVALQQGEQNRLAQQQERQQNRLDDKEARKIGIAKLLLSNFDKLTPEAREKVKPILGETLGIDASAFDFKSEDEAPEDPLRLQSFLEAKTSKTPQEIETLRLLKQERGLSTRETEAGTTLDQARAAQIMLKAQPPGGQPPAKLSEFERNMQRFIQLNEEDQGTPLTGRKKTELDVLQRKVLPASLGRQVGEIAQFAAQNPDKPFDAGQQRVLNIAKDFGIFQRMGLGLLPGAGGQQQAVNLAGPTEDIQQALASGVTDETEVVRGLREAYEQFPNQRQSILEKMRILGFSF